MIIVPFTLTLANDYYPQKYKQILQQDGFNSELKEILFQIVSKAHLVTSGEADQLISSCSENDNCFKHKSLSHKMMKKNLFGNLHLQEDDNGLYVKDYYCNKKFRERQGVGEMLEPLNNLVNTEHSWPRSKFSSNFSKAMQTDDLHHLFPTDSRANSFRSNYAFGNVISGKQVNSSCKISIRGYVDQDSPNSKFFDPPTEVKGDIARAMFYFSVRYKIRIYEPQETFLRFWHYLDPVSDWERDRNDRILELQFNRNPFIDYPHLVENISDF